MSNNSVMKLIRKKDTLLKRLDNANIKLLLLQIDLIDPFIF